MDLYSFNRLCINERAEFTWNNAMFLDSIKYQNVAFSLYHTKKFYIRIQYDSGFNKITAVNVFKSSKPLDPFIESIDIVNMFE